MVGSWVCRQLLFGWLLLAGSSGQGLSDEEEADSVEISEEELERIAGRQLASLQDMGEDQKRNFQDFALGWYNDEEYHSVVFKPLGAANVTVKKAIGSMMYIHLFLEKTNCTNEDLNNYYRSVENSDSIEDQHPTTYCGPLPERMQLDCTFGVFQDERSSYDTVVNHKCKPMGLAEYPDIPPPYHSDM